MPLLAGSFLLLGLASLGLPGTSGFPAELLLILSALGTHIGAGLATLLEAVMAAGNFSLDAEVRISARDRAGLGRLLRYCAHRPFALARLDRIDHQHIIYRLPRPRRDGTTALSRTPLALIDQLARRIQPPRLHRQPCHGALAPNFPMRAAATAYGRDLTDDPTATSKVAATPAAAAPHTRSPPRYLWTMLLARLVESPPPVCPNCRADLRIIAVITGRARINVR